MTHTHTPEAKTPEKLTRREKQRERARVGSTFRPDTPRFLRTGLTETGPEVGRLHLLDTQSPIMPVALQIPDSTRLFSPTLR